MCSLVPRDMCSPACETHIPSEMCCPTWETHIPVKHISLGYYYLTVESVDEIQLIK